MFSCQSGSVDLLCLAKQSIGETEPDFSPYQCKSGITPVQCVELEGDKLGGSEMRNRPMWAPVSNNQPIKV